jgi:exopolysaccharide biosynthesis protein
VAEVAKVLKSLGVEGALNLDSGGSTAFLVNGKYVVGPGRQTPFGIVLVGK